MHPGRGCRRCVQWGDGAALKTPVSEVEPSEPVVATSLSKPDSSSPETAPPSFASTDIAAVQEVALPPGSDQGVPRESSESVHMDEGEPGSKGAITEADSPAATSQERIAQLHEQMWLDAQSQANGDVVASAPNAPVTESSEPAAVDQIVEPTSLAPPIDLARAIAAARELGELLLPHPAVLLENLPATKRSDTDDCV